MRIGIIGSGNIGGTAARLFTEAGHEVALSHSGPPETLREQVSRLGRLARAATVEDAAKFGDVVLLALPWRERESLPRRELRGKFVVDATNPYRPDLSLYELDGSTSSEEVLKALPGVRLVKAFNTLYAGELATRGRKDLPLDDRPALLLAGDDVEAKQIVAHLVAEIGFAPVDSGSLRQGGRLQEPGSPLYARIISGVEARAALERAKGETDPERPGAAHPNGG